MDSTQAKALIQSLQGKSIGGWKVDGSFGHGKSAVVVLASRNGVKGALKVFHPELIERYGREVQLARIDREKSLIGSHHPNLVQIYDGGECEETKHLFVVMEEIPFRNLQEALKDIPLISVRPLISQIASAAKFLEEKGLAHRDIKPENIAISFDFSTAKLLDLGVVRPFGISNITDIDQRPFIGTLRYSSPEFLLRKEENTKEGWRSVTFYQIGAVLHDLLMKKELFSEHSEPYSALVEAVLKQNPHVYGPDPTLVRLCNHCLIKNPHTRLELVNWNDFLEINSGKQPAVDIREKVKNRQKYFRSLANSEDVAPGEIRRLSKQRLEDLCNEFESLVGIALNGLQCFPLRKRVSKLDVTEELCDVSIHFEKDEELGLPLHLTILFRIQLVDGNSGNPIYRVTAAAAVSPVEIPGDAIQDFMQISIGNLDEILDTAKLEEVFLKALDAVYETLESQPDVQSYDLTALSI